MKKNILFVNYSLGLGGIERLLLELSKKLNIENKYNIFMVVFSSLDGIKSEFENNNINVITLQKKEGLDFTLIFKLKDLIKELNIHLIHSQAQNTWLYSVLAAKLSNIPIISTIHSGTYKYDFKQKIRWNILTFLLSIITNKITTVGKHLEQDFYNLGVRKKKVVTIYNGVDFRKFNSENIEEVENALIIVARLCFQKNHLMLFKAINIAKNSIPDIKLYVVGDGYLQSELEEYINKNKLENNIIMMGKRDDIPFLLSSKSIFILPSIIEGLPISLLEAMSSKRAIIASDIPANTEVITDKTHGLIINPQDKYDIADKIIKLYLDKDLQETLANNAYHRVITEFSFEKMKEKYMALYKELLNPL